VGGGSEACFPRYGWLWKGVDRPARGKSLARTASRKIGPEHGRANQAAYEQHKREDGSEKPTKCSPQN
jgi:hypothetical protein